MFFLSDINNVEFGEKRSKVKSYVRKGKVVRSHDRKIDVKSALLGSGIGALGVGALTGAFLLGKGKVPKQVIQQVSVNADDIANKVISKLPTQPNININTDEIVNKVVSKIKLPQQQNIDIDDVVNKVVARIPQPQQQAIDVDQLAKEVGKQIKLPDYNELIKQFSNSLPKQQIQEVNKTVEDVKELVEDKLGNVTRKRRERLASGKYTKILTDDWLTNPNTRETWKNKIVDKFKRMNIDQQDLLTETVRQRRLDIEKAMGYQKTTPEALKTLSKLNDRYLLIDNEIRKLRLNRNTFDTQDFIINSFRDATVRQNIVKEVEIGNLTKERMEKALSAGYLGETEINKIKDAGFWYIFDDVKLPWDDDYVNPNNTGSYLDDFSAANRLIEFCNYIQNAPLFFLSDF